MTSNQTPFDQQEKPGNETDMVPLVKGHHIDVTPDDHDSVVTCQKGLCAVMPAYNEEVSIGTSVLRTKQYVDHVIVVDDGSSDRTAEVAKFAGAEVIRLEHTTGKVYSLLLGLRRARETGCNVAVVIDANGNYNPLEIPRVVRPIVDDEADLVIGSRYLDRQGPLLSFEKYGQMMLESGTRVTDSASRFMAFSRKTLESLDFKTQDSRLSQDLISTLDTQGFRISDVSITLQKHPIEDSFWDFPVKVLAAMPAYNEEMFIAKTILVAQQYVDRVLVVDDGSTDATGEIAQKMGALVLRHQKNAGYGAALRTIFDKAKELDVDALVILDADGQHNPQDIQTILDRLEKGDVDVVIGSRFVREIGQKIPRYRMLGMKVLDHATALAGADTTTDSQSGFRGYGKKAINAIQISMDGMSAGSEILVRVAENELKIAEIPITVRYDIANGSSQHPVKHGALVLYNLIGMISYRRPLPVFGIPGFILVILGLIVGYWAFSDYSSPTKIQFISSMLSTLFLIIGFLLMIGALILNYLVTTKQIKTIYSK
jgi:glycosyltransferase involved in cell wall biosynthesis